MTTPKAKFAGLALIATLVFGTTAPAWAGFDEGMAAYNRGDYPTMPASGCSIAMFPTNSSAAWRRAIRLWPPRSRGN